MTRFIVGFLIGAASVGGLGACGKISDHPSHSNRKATAKTQVATIVKIIDGDTIRAMVSGQEKTVRLIGIDTPETHKPGVKVECGGKKASANMKRLAPVGAKARLTSDPTQDEVDRYGRLLAYVTVNHRRLQLEQLYAGLAEVYVYGSKPFERVDAYRRAEGVAQRAHRGVWGACGSDFHSEQSGGQR